jgi:hypothetical protein
MSNYLHDPERDAFIANYNNRAVIKFNEYKSNEINDNIVDNIIILNNSMQSHGFISFMKSFKDFQNKNIKIFLYKKNNLELVIGPIYIDSTQKLAYINNYILKSINRENFAYYKNDMEKIIKEYFHNEINLINFYY